MQDGALIRRRRSRPSTARQADEQAVTAVVEFLGAFVLFLVVVTAFLSLAQLTLGTNEPSVDRLDRSAIDGLRTITNDPGWFIPEHANGSRDLANATADWHVFNATVLNAGDLAAGLTGRDGRLDAARIAGLANVTETQLARGLGLDDDDSIRLELRVTESWDANRTGLVLIDAGSPRNASTSSAVATRHLRLGNETVLVTLEVHDAGLRQPLLRIMEFMPQPSGGLPEWVEVQNPDALAIDLTGFAILRDDGGSLVGGLVGGGYLEGGARALFSGDPGSQIPGNASLVIDKGADGTLGRGAIDGMGNSTGTVALTYAELGSASAIVIQRIDYTPAWGGAANSSFDYLSGDPTDNASWQVIAGGTPGDL